MEHHQPGSYNRIRSWWSWMLKKIRINADVAHIWRFPKMWVPLFIIHLFNRVFHDKSSSYWGISFADFINSSRTRVEMVSPSGWFSFPPCLLWSRFHLRMGWEIRGKIEESPPFDGPWSFNKDHSLTVISVILWMDVDGRNPAPVDRWFIDLSHYL